MRRKRELLEELESLLKRSNLKVKRKKDLPKPSLYRRQDSLFRNWKDSVAAENGSTTDQLDTHQSGRKRRRPTRSLHSLLTTDHALYTY